jgi:hypothetical protein
MIHVTTWDDTDYAHIGLALKQTISLLTVYQDRPKPLGKSQSLTSFPILNKIKF